MSVKTLNITIKGTSALMTHNGTLCDPLFPITKSIKLLSSKRTKTDNDLYLMMQLETLGGIYPEHDLTVDDENPGYEVTDKGVQLTGDWGHCMIPESVIEATLLSGAKKRKQGPLFKAGLRVLNPSYIMINQKPVTVEEVFINRKHRLTNKVKIGTSSIMRTRPIYPNWSLNFDAMIDDEVLNLEAVKDATDIAGKLVGMAEWRPRYGSFTLEEIRLVA